MKQPHVGIRLNRRVDRPQIKQTLRPQGNLSQATSGIAAQPANAPKKRLLSQNNGRARLRYLAQPSAPSRKAPDKEVPHAPLRYFQCRTTVSGLHGTCTHETSNTPHLCVRHVELLEVADQTFGQRVACVGVLVLHCVESSSSEQSKANSAQFFSLPVED